MLRLDPSSLPVRLLLPLPLLCLGGLLGSCSSATSTEPATRTVLPASVATTPVPRDEAWWTERHGRLNARMQAQPPRLVFLGDSITQGWEEAGSDVWKAYFAERDAVNLGISGDRTQHVLWRLRNGNLEGAAPELAVVMIGTNNSGDDTSEDIAKGVRAIVEELRRRAPSMEILLLAIFPRGADPDDLRRGVNAQASRLFASLSADPKVHFLDIKDVFLEPDGTLPPAVMPDLLHLSPEGYARWARAIESVVAKELGE